MEKNEIQKEIDYIYRVKFNLTITKDLMKDIKRLVELELLLNKTAEVCELEIEKALDEHRKLINTDFREQYAEELGLDEGENVAQAVYDCDYESIDFNIGFEQGYMRGLEVALTILKNK